MCANIADLEKCLHNVCLLANIGFDVAQNEPSNDCYNGLTFYIILQFHYLDSFFTDQLNDHNSFLLCGGIQIQ